MPIYLVKHTTLLHNKKVYGEGSKIDLTEEQAARISDFVELIPEEQKSSSNKTTQKSTKSEQKADSNKTAKETVQEDGDKK